tara:strand:- start:48 stop:1001 length:954 start_codon:yes stop_codon:yes gene_type:complete
MKNEKLFRALLIGCGNIGFRYDHNDKDLITTHASAFNSCSDIIFDVSDSNEETAVQAANHYGANHIGFEELEEKELNHYDIISIATPTDSHANFLCRAINENVKVAICEKPISYNLEDIARIKNVYNEPKSNTKVLVNYTRRFQPLYLDLKKRIKSLNKKENCSNITISYQRGFINNGSHAIDLLQFLFDEIIAFDKMQIIDHYNDAFIEDPTITANFFLRDTVVSMIGLHGFKIPVFEINLFFETTKICLLNFGNVIELYQSGENELRQSNILDDSMLNVIKHAKSYFMCDNQLDNFDESLELNTKMLKIINDIRI